MRIFRIFLVIVFLISISLYFSYRSFATNDERAVLSVVGSYILNDDPRVTCLSTWTSPRFESGTYGFRREGLQQNKVWLDITSYRARGRDVILYAGAPASNRPIFINRTVDMAVGCARPTQLSTPIFAGNLAFVSVRTESPYVWGKAFALRRIRGVWTIIEVVDWDNREVV